MTTKDDPDREAGDVRRSFLDMNVEGGDVAAKARCPDSRGVYLGEQILLEVGEVVAFAPLAQRP